MTATPPLSIVAYLRARLTKANALAKRRLEALQRERAWSDTLQGRLNSSEARVRELEAAHADLLARIAHHVSLHGPAACARVEPAPSPAPSPSPANAPAARRSDEK